MKKFKNMMLAAIALGVGFTFAGVDVASAQEKKLDIGGSVRVNLNLTETTDDGTTSSTRPMHAQVRTRVDISGEQKTKNGMTAAFNTRLETKGAGTTGKDIEVSVDTGTVKVSAGQLGESEVCVPANDYVGPSLDNCITGLAAPQLSVGTSVGGADITLGLIVDSAVTDTVTPTYTQNSDNVTVDKGKDSTSTEKTKDSGFDLGVELPVGPATVGLTFSSGTTGAGSEADAKGNTASGTSQSQFGVSAVMGMNAIEVGIAVGSGSSSNSDTSTDTATTHTKVGASMDLGGAGTIAIAVGTKAVKTTTTGDVTETTSSTHIGYSTDLAGMGAFAEYGSDSTKKDTSGAKATTNSTALVGLQYKF